MGAAATPGSQQDFVVNVGDRVFFDTDSSELSDQARATLDKQAQWLNNYNRYSFTIEGHADERGTREYNIALGARRAETVREYLISRGVSAAAHAHHLLRQGAAGRGVQRYFLLVAEPPRRDRARSELINPRPRIACKRSAPSWRRLHFDCNLIASDVRALPRRRPKSDRSDPAARYRLRHSAFISVFEEVSAMTLRLVCPRHAAACVAAGAAACGQNNQYAAPPPPKVTVAAPVEQDVTRYFEATGNTAAVNSVDLVARVQGFVQAISYKDGDFVKKGTSLFTIEPEPYKLKVTAAKAAVVSAQATLTQAQAEYDRQADLIAKQVSTQANYDKALAQRDSAQADLQSAQANEQQAEINLGYTDVTAPFDGVVTARQVSIGQLVGASSPTVLATIVQLDPIWVNFTASERDVLQVRAILAGRGETTAALIGHAGRSRTAERKRLSAPGQARLRRAECRSVDRDARRARHPGERRSHAAAGLFRARAHSSQAAAGACWCPTSRSAAIRAAATCSSSTRTMSSSSARSSPASWSASCASSRKASPRTTVWSSAASCARFPARRSMPSRARRRQTSA